MVQITQMVGGRLGSNRDHLAFTTYSYVEIINVHQHWSSPGQMAFLYSLHKSQQTVKGCNFADHVLSVAMTHLCPCSTRAAIDNMQENKCNFVPRKAHLQNQVATPFDPQGAVYQHCLSSVGFESSGGSS